MIKTGRIDIVDSANDRVIKSLGKGEHFGERALLTDQTWKYTAFAAEDSVLIALEKDVLDRMISGFGSFETMLRKSARTYASHDKIEAITSQLPESARARRVGELMNPDVSQLSEAQTLADALQLAKGESHSTFPVVDGDGRFKGVILKEDIYDKLKQAGAPLDTLVGEMNQRGFPCIREDAPVPDAIELLLRGGTSKVVVIDGDERLRGILALIDLIASARAEDSFDGGSGSQ